ncbi:hypothetical protein [Coleofasciculus sp. B1-GNL1-01]|uniref:hypothetical protein n=1 Tax=Coleofasciculus sp. B1-GNL1-01 TaxID=3068484 RepID=UPI004063DB40
MQRLYNLNGKDIILIWCLMIGFVVRALALFGWVSWRQPNLQLTSALCFIPIINYLKLRNYSSRRGH